jgi:hypothetical protein
MTRAERAALAAPETPQPESRTTMSIRRTLAALAATAALVLVGAASPAMAGNVHFIKNATTATLDGVDLVFEFKEAGLESGASVQVEASADLQATYQCFNNGGKVPSDPKKTTISSRIADVDDFTATKNGNIVGDMTLSPIEADEALDCPNGQRATLTEALWSNASLTDLTNDVSISVPIS